MANDIEQQRTKKLPPSAARRTNSFKQDAILSDCLNSSLKIVTESEEPNMDSFPLHMLEFKAMIPSLFGV